MRRVLLLVLIASFLMAAAALADVPPLINYQGVLTSGGAAVSTTVTVVFNLWDDPSAGTSLWAETQDVTPDTLGRFNVSLGSVNPIPDSCFWGTDLYLGVKVGTDAEMTPRQRLMATGYAFRDSWGRGDTARGADAVIGGGLGNAIESSFSVIAGGERNQILNQDEYPSDHSFIGGGEDNTIENYSGNGVICGGSRNYLGQYAYGSCIGGGDWNTISQERSVICGGLRNEINHTSTFEYSFIGAGHYNSISAGYGCVIGGGMNNTIVQYADGSVIAGGLDNIVTNRYSAVLGGMRNLASGEFSVIAGGGGYSSQQDSNAAAGYLSSILGGRNNVASGDSSSIGGGTQNIAGGACATVPGGHLNEASGTYSFAAGNRAKATRDGSFVWGDVTDADFEATFPNQFLIRASGGVGIGTNTPTHELEVVGDVSLSGDLYIPSDSRIMNGNNRAVIHTAWRSAFGDYTALNSGYDWTSKEPTSVVAARNGVFFTVGLDGSEFATILAKIDTLGNMGLGTSSPNYKLDVRGTIGNNATLYHSDRRWKREISTINDALSKVSRLRGVTFDWRRDEFPEMNFPEGAQIGLIAQEVEEVLPELVNTNAEGYKSVEYANLVAVLIEAVKELSAENADMKSRLTEVESQLAETLAKK